MIFEPQSWAGGFHLTVITSGSSAGAAITRYGFPGADGGPALKSTDGSIQRDYENIIYYNHIVFAFTEIRITLIRGPSCGRALQYNVKTK